MKTEQADIERGWQQADIERTSTTTKKKPKRKSYKNHPTTVVERPK